MSGKLFKFSFYRYIIYGSGFGVSGVSVATKDVHNLQIYKFIRPFFSFRAGKCPGLILHLHWSWQENASHRWIGQEISFLVT